MINILRIIPIEHDRGQQTPADVMRKASVVTFLPKFFGGIIHLVHVIIYFASDAPGIISAGSVPTVLQLTCFVSDR